MPHWAFDAGRVLWDMVLLYAVGVLALALIGLVCEWMRRDE